MICAAIPVLCVVMLDLLLHIKACLSAILLLHATAVRYWSSSTYAVH